MKGRRRRVVMKTAIICCLAGGRYGWLISKKEVVKCVKW